MSWPTGSLSPPGPASRLPEVTLMAQPPRKGAHDTPIVVAAAMACRRWCPDWLTYDRNLRQRRRPAMGRCTRWRIGRARRRCRPAPRPLPPPPPISSPNPRTASQRTARPVGTRAAGRKARTTAAVKIRRCEGVRGNSWRGQHVTGQVGRGMEEVKTNLVRKVADFSTPQFKFLRIRIH
jgi:hypothetical protein